MVDHAHRVEGRWQSLAMSDPADWLFVGGRWSQDADGLMSPPKAAADENLAIYHGQHFADCEVEFEFRWNTLCCGGGVLFRGRDARHHYLVEFPCTGQQYRAEWFWACVAKVDDRGWAKVLHTQTLHGVPSEIGLWHRCRLVVRGGEIRLWVDGRPFPAVHDETYRQPGHFGLFSYDGLGNGSPLSFRHVRIRGSWAAGSVWNSTVAPARNWYYPTQEETYGKVHHLSSFVRMPNGDLLMKLSAGHEFHGQQYTPVFIRSRDGGRTWSAMERLPESMARSVLFVTRGGEVYQFRMQGEPPFAIARARSCDHGLTWSDFEDCGCAGFGDDVDIAVANHLIELADGTLLWSMYRHSTRPPAEHKGSDHWSYCIRSTDQGRHWSEPVDMDGKGPPGAPGMIQKHFGSETSLAQTRQGRILALVRTYFGPVMWETWSDDGGRSWTPACRGPFGMWACTCAMSSTRSGALLIAGRHPGMAIQVSADDGMTWDCYRFDTTFWANGFTWEIEPDLVMFASTGKYADPLVRVHLFRLTADGPEPASP